MGRSHSNPDAGPTGATDPADGADPRVEVLRKAGRSARKAVPRHKLGAWEAPADRADPVDILQAQNVTRVQDLVPLRFERMSVSPFTFYRGAAAIMAADLGTRPRTPLEVQLAGDAHLSNFGGFATPERTLIFDLNDFDETHPGPFEWDVERLVASFAVAGRNARLSATRISELVAAVSSSYVSAMTEFAGMDRLEVWYARMSAEDILERWGHEERLTRSRVEAFNRRVAKARQKNSQRAVSRYTQVGADGQLHIISQPPLVVPVTELFSGATEGEVRALAEKVMSSYRQTLPDDRRLLLSGYSAVDMGRKVVGVGSVGTRCWISLLVAQDDASDDLVLQIKEAGPSVLESVTAPSRYPNHGQRVIEGQRLMQAAGDILLGWTRVPGADGVERDYYVRQMWDWKVSADLERFDHGAMIVYGQLCGWTLARAHARTGDRKALAGYLGTGRAFTRAMQEFADSYADQNQRDYDALMAAIDSGRVTRSNLEEDAAASATVGQ
jgi:uncharacterized protein (DUF2252 family)